MGKRAALFGFFLVWLVGWLPGLAKAQATGSGSIEVTSKPESGMMIFLNEQNSGKVTPYTFEDLPAGDYQIKLASPWYHTQARKVTVVKDRSQVVAFSMRSQFAVISINAPEDAKIFIRDQLVGNTKWSGRLVEGVCKVRVEKSGFQIREFQLSVIAGKNDNINVTLQNFVGHLDIASEPSGAIISIAGTIYGLTPFTISDMPVGNHIITLTKAGYTTLSVPSEVKAGQITKVEAKLLSGKQVGIVSEPTGAHIFIRDSLVGVAPHSIFLEYGEYNIRLVKGDMALVDKLVIAHAGGNTFTFKLKDSNDPLENQMVFVQGGTFSMGDTFGDGSKYEKPVRDVTVSDFYISKFEVSQKIWELIMGSNPSHFKGCDNCPVERVSWNQIQEFLSRLNELTGKEYRLPTEAEWEYAARGGNKSQGHKYSGGYNINDVSWYSGNSGNKTHPSGQMRANELGLYDMSGNVWEWCADWFGAYSKASEGPELNPIGPSSGDGRVTRGGSWFGFIGANRLSFRGFDEPSNSRSYIGFRVVLPSE